jgi:hypothetical protein
MSYPFRAKTREEEKKKVQRKEIENPYQAINPTSTEME